MVAFDTEWELLEDVCENIDLLSNNTATKIKDYFM